MPVAARCHITFCCYNLSNLVLRQTGSRDSFEVSLSDGELIQLGLDEECVTLLMRDRDNASDAYDLVSLRYG